MGIIDKIFGKNKITKPLLDPKTQSLIGIEFAMYLSWVEETTKKSIMGKELTRRIELFLKKEKEIGRINDFNEDDVTMINILALSSDIDRAKENRKNNNLDHRWPKMEEHIGLKKK